MKRPELDHVSSSKADMLDVYFEYSKKLNKHIDILEQRIKEKEQLIDDLNYSIGEFQSKGVFPVVCSECKKTQNQDQ